MDLPHCYQCGTTEPVAAYLGWVELRYSLIADWSRTFCGSTCLHQWSNSALARLTAAILGEQAAPGGER